MYVVLMCGVQAALIGVGKEKDQLVEQVQSLVAASQERDTLSQQLSSAQQLLQEAQVCAHVLFLSVFYIMRMYVHHKHRNVVYCGSCTSIHQSVTIDERSEPTHIHSCLNFDIPNQRVVYIVVYTGKYVEISTLVLKFSTFVCSPLYSYFT